MENKNLNEYECECECECLDRSEKFQQLCNTPGIEPVLNLKGIKQCCLRYKWLKAVRGRNHFILDQLMDVIRKIQAEYEKYQKGLGDLMTIKNKSFLEIPETVTSYLGRFYTDVLDDAERCYYWWKVLRFTGEVLHYTFIAVTFFWEVITNKLWRGQSVTPEEIDTIKKLWAKNQGDRGFSTKLDYNIRELRYAFGPSNISISEEDRRIALSAYIKMGNVDNVAKVLKKFSKDHWLASSALTLAIKTRNALIIKLVNNYYGADDHHVIAACENNTVHHLTAFQTGEDYGEATEKLPDKICRIIQKMESTHKEKQIEISIESIAWLLDNVHEQYDKLAEERYAIYLKLPLPIYHTVNLKCLVYIYEKIGRDPEKILLHPKTVCAQLTMIPSVLVQIILSYLWNMVI